jgi:hypothetical protein
VAGTCWWRLCGRPVMSPRIDYKKSEHRAQHEPLRGPQGVQPDTLLEARCVRLLSRT